MNKIRLLIADDHTLFRDGIRELLKNNPEIEIIAEASESCGLFALYLAFMPDVMLVDIAMPVKSGIDAVKDILEIDRSAKALFLSMYSEDAFIYKVYKAGGKGLISKNIHPMELILAIQTVSSGGLYFGRNYSANALNDLVRRFEEVQSSYEDKFRRSLDPPITDREFEVLKLIGKGLTSAEISETLEIGRRTVDKHRENISHKYNISSLIELLKFALSATEDKTPEDKTRK